MTEKKKDVTTHDTWGDLGQKKEGRQRHNTNPMLVERPSTKMIAIGGPPPPKVPESRPLPPRSKTSTLMGVPYTPPRRDETLPGFGLQTQPVTPPARISKTFKRPAFDSVPPSQPLIDVTDMFPDVPAIEQPKPVVAPKPATLWQKFLAFLRRLRILR